LIIGFGIEILQSYGVKFLAGAYDPLDIMMYALGVGLGFVVDVYVFDMIRNKK
jgi:hypothetical protein